MRSPGETREIFLKNSCCYIVSAVLFFFVLYPLCVCASPDTIGIETEGTCTVYGNDRAPARDSAIGDSMRMAVERVVGMLISEEVATENADALHDNIYPKHQDYIHDYRILKEGVDSGLYRIRVRATLSVKDIKRDLEKLGVLTGEWRPEYGTTAVIGVVVRGIEKYGDFRTLREALEKGIRGVDAVHLLRVGSGVAVMNVEMQGDASILANQLQLKEFRNFSLSVAQITQDTIEFNMAKE